MGERSSVPMASKVSRPVAPTAVGSAWYIAVSSVSASLRQLRACRSKAVSVCATSTGSGPRNERTSCDENETACVTSRPGISAIARSSQPVGVCLSPGVPDSWKSWASKCERVTAGLPTAWTKARRPSRNSGSSGASSGCMPK